MKQKYLGSMIGSALGDAIGEIVLYKAGCGCIYPEDIDKVISKDELIKHINKFNILKYTDDTHMAIGTAESLINCGSVKKQHMLERYIANYTLDPWRGYGKGATYLFAMVNDMSIPYKKAMKKINKAYFNGIGSYGNGGAMRINPVGLFFYDKNIYKCAKAVTTLTHSNPIGIDGSAVLAKAVSMAVKLDLDKPFDKEDFINELIKFSHVKEIKNKMINVKTLLMGKSSSLEVAQILGQTTSVHESMPMAIYSFLKHPNSFKDCLFTSILNGGDADTVGAMACGLSGAYLGINAIPQEWILKLENHEYIKALAEMLYDTKKNGKIMSYEKWRSTLNLVGDNDIDIL